MWEVQLIARRVPSQQWKLYIYGICGMMMSENNIVYKDPHKKSLFQEHSKWRSLHLLLGRPDVVFWKYAVFPYFTKYNKKYEMPILLDGV